MNCRHTSYGYTILEAAIAAAILMIGVAAAVALSLTAVTQEEINARVARALNVHEQAVRLFQLGLSVRSPDEVNALLPPDPAIESIAFSEPTNSIVASDLNVTVDEEISTMTCHTAAGPSFWTELTWAPGPDSETATRTHEIRAIRPRDPPTTP